MRFNQTLTEGATAAVMLASTVLPAFAKPPGAQVFSVYDNTYDGLVLGTDPDMGNVQVVANPGGSNKLIINTHVQGAAPDCELSVDLVYASEASNGGLDETGHTGNIIPLGTLTTNSQGNGNFHTEIEVGDGTLDTAMYGHIDFEDYSGTCEEADGTTVANNEYGAAPDPTLDTPLTWMQ